MFKMFWKNTNGYSDEAYPVWPNCARATCVHRSARCLREKSDIPRTLRGPTQLPIVVLLSTRAQPVCFSAAFETRPSKSAGILDFVFIYQTITGVHAAAWGRNSIFHTRHRRVRGISPGRSEMAKTMKRCLTAVTIRVNRARTVARTRAAQYKILKALTEADGGWASRRRNVSIRTTKVGPFAGLSWSCAPVCAEQRTSIETVRVRRRCRFTRFSFVGYDVIFEHREINENSL